MNEIRIIINQIELTLDSVHSARIVHCTRLNRRIHTMEWDRPTRRLTDRQECRWALRGFVNVIKYFQLFVFFKVVAAINCRWALLPI